MQRDRKQRSFNIGKSSMELEGTHAENFVNQVVYFCNVEAKSYQTEILEV